MGNIQSHPMYAGHLFYVESSIRILYLTAEGDRLANDACWRIVTTWKEGLRQRGKLIVHIEDHNSIVRILPSFIDTA